MASEGERQFADVVDVYLGFVPAVKSVWRGADRIPSDVSRQDIRSGGHDPVSILRDPHAHRGALEVEVL